jgi:hypothetical protein
MADVLRQTRRRGGIMAATGIVVLAIGQASLTDPSRCQRSSPAVTDQSGSGLWFKSGFYYEAEPSRSARNSDSAKTACSVSATRHERPRLVDPDFLRSPDIAAKTVASAAN